MPPEIKTDRSVMLDATIGIIEEAGADAVSARAVAKKLGISTQPIYREFGDMDGLIDAATVRGFEIYAESVKGEALDQASAYVKFACERSNLFKFLFRRRKIEFDGLESLSHCILSSSDIIDRLSEITGLDRERVYRLHLYVWMATTGLATIAADNGTSIDDGELRDFTMELTKALTQYYNR